MCLSTYVYVHATINNSHIARSTTLLTISLTNSRWQKLLSYISKQAAKKVMNLGDTNIKNLI